MGRFLNILASTLGPHSSFPYGHSDALNEQSELLAEATAGFLDSVV